MPTKTKRLMTEHQVAAVAGEFYDVLHVEIKKRELYKTLAALAAFNELTIDDCATRILESELKRAMEELNFHGEMEVA